MFRDIFFLPVSGSQNFPFRRSQFASKLRSGNFRIQVQVGGYENIFFSLPSSLLFSASNAACSV